MAAHSDRQALTFPFIAGLAICAGAALRVFGSVSTAEKRFYQMLVLNKVSFDVMFAFQMLALGDHTPAWYFTYTGVIGIAVRLTLAGLIFYLPDESEEVSAAPARNSFAELLKLASPAFFTVALLYLSIGMIRRYFYFGVGCILAAFLLYGLRAALVQRKYEHLQFSLQQARGRLEQLSMKDPLTGIANRRCFVDTLEGELSRAMRTRSPLSLLLVDVDYFKYLNDRKGHVAGDDCLVQIALALSSVLARSSDFVARYGGEEFAVILPSTDLAGAQIMAEKLRDRVHDLQIENETEIGRYISVSVGIATYTYPYKYSAMTLVEASDGALYEAKRKGRNRVEIAPS